MLHPDTTGVSLHLSLLHLLSFTLSIPSLYIYITNCTNNITNSNTIPRPPLPHTSPHTCSTSSSIFITFFTFFFTLVYISFSLVLVCFSQRYLFVLFCFLFLFLYLLHTSTIPLYQTILPYNPYHDKYLTPNPTTNTIKTQNHTTLHTSLTLLYYHDHV